MIKHLTKWGGGAYKSYPHKSGKLVEKSQANCTAQSIERDTRACKPHSQNSKRYSKLHNIFVTTVAFLLLWLLAFNFIAYFENEKQNVDAAGTDYYFRYIAITFDDRIDTFLTDWKQFEKMDDASYEYDSSLSDELKTQIKNSWLYFIGDRVTSFTYSLDYDAIKTELLKHNLKLNNLYTKNDNGTTKLTFTSSTTLTQASFSGEKFIGYTLRKGCAHYVFQLFATVETVSSTSITINYYDQGGGKFSGDKSGYPTTHTNGSDTDLSMYKPTKTGYTFGGWYLNDKTCTSNKVETLSADITYTEISLYAKWTPNMYNITYYYVGTSTVFSTKDWGGATYPTTHTYNTSTTLKTPTITTEKYTFEGWYTNQNGTGAISSLGATSYTSDIKLYGRLVERKITLTLTCEDYGNQQYMIYIFSGDDIYMQLMPTKKTETITLGGVDKYSVAKYKVCFVFGYYGNLTVTSTANQTTSNRAVTLNSFANTTITYKIATPSINSSIMI